MGEMAALDRRPTVHVYAETHLFMSNQCFVSYEAHRCPHPSMP